VFNAPENSKTERGGLNLVDPEKKYLWDACVETGSWWGLKCKTCGRRARPRKCIDQNSIPLSLFWNFPVN